MTRRNSCSPFLKQKCSKHLDQLSSLIHLWHENFTRPLRFHEQNIADHFK
jgi:hypothetical protein